MNRSMGAVIVAAACALIVAAHPSYARMLGRAADSAKVSFMSDVCIDSLGFPMYECVIADFMECCTTTQPCIYGCSYTSED